MRGRPSPQVSFVAVSPEQRIPADHPIRRVKALADKALKTLSPQLDAVYASGGRPSIPPETLLKAQLLIALFTVRSERLFCEQLQYNLLFQWFLDLDLSSGGFDASTFSKNRERLLEADAARQFLLAVIGEARAAGLMSSDHFTVDGTLVDAWASMKSVRPRDAQAAGDGPTDPGNDGVDFKGERRTNQTHASTTDPEARLARKSAGGPTRLALGAHVLMENRNGLVVDVRVTQVSGTAEREQALAMLGEARARGFRVRTLGADKGYDTLDFVRALRERGVAPHVARNIHVKHPSAVDDATAASTGYKVSLKVRKRVEEIFGWAKTVGGLRKSRYVGTRKTGLLATLHAAAYNLVRMARLLQAPAPAPA